VESSLTFPHRKGRSRSRAPAPDLTSDRDPLGFGDRAMGRAITSRGGDARMADARQFGGVMANGTTCRILRSSIRRKRFSNGRQILVRTFLVNTLAAVVFTFLIVDWGYAARIGLNTTYTRLQLKDLCDQNGGTYEESSGSYSCRKHGDGDHWCMVECKNPFSCYGKCPKCVARIRDGFGRNAGVGTILGSCKRSR